MVKRLQKELEAMQKNADVFRVSLPTNDLRLWYVDFVGAKNTIYEN
jgi:ubiquitin-protein ligase